MLHCSMRFARVRHRAAAARKATTGYPDEQTPMTHGRFAAGRPTLLLRHGNAVEVGI
jgi:hypothetical protein